MKIIADKDLGIDCDYKAEGDTDEEVMNDMNKHIKRTHPDRYDEVKTRIRSAVREVSEDSMDDEEI